jgi:hypothetical protein
MRLSTMDEIEALAAKLKSQGQCEAWLSEAHPSLKNVSFFSHALVVPCLCDTHRFRAL